MATRRYGVRPGENEYEVTESVGAAVDSDTVELTVDLAAGLDGSTRAISREEVVQALDKIRNHILRGSWPPA
jgi:hypothetical protein